MLFKNTLKLLLLSVILYIPARTAAQCTATLTANGPTTFCDGGNVTLQASPSGLYDYQWFINGVPDMLGNESYSFAPMDPGTYVLTVQITDNNNCTVISNPITVTVSAVPFLYWYYGDIGCIGDTMHIGCSSDIPATYTWTGPNGYTANTIDAEILNFQATNIGTYTLVADNNGCTSTVSVGVDTFSGPTPSLTAYAYTMFGGPFCEGEWFAIDGIDSGLMNVTYSWTGPNSFTYNDHYYNTFWTSMADSGLYTLTVTGNNCYGNFTLTDTALVDMHPTPIVTVTGNGPVCAGSTFQFDGTVTNATSYYWDGPDNYYSTSLTNSISNMQMVNSGGYMLHAVNGQCEGTAIADGTVLPNNPSISHYYPGDGHIFCAGENVYIHCYPDSITSPDYTWVGPNGIVVNNDQMWIFGVTNADSGQYIVYVTDTNCNGPFTLTDTFTVDVRPCIWPGDVNYDMTADNIDVLDVGLAYGTFGTARPQPSNAWVGAYLIDWGQAQFNGADMKHADCNGNGIITASDTNAISLNYGYVHQKGVHLPQAKSTAYPDLYFDMLGITLTPGAAVSIPIKLGTNAIPMVDVYGLAAQVKITGIAPDELIITAISGWMGDISNAMNFTKLITPTQTDWAYVRTDHNNVSGNGTIALLDFVVPAGTDYQQVLMYFDNVKIIGNTGNVITNVNIVDGDATVYPTKIVAAQTIINSAVIVPNPSESDARLQLSLMESSKMDIIVTDITGRKVWNNTINAVKGQQDILLPATGLSAGIYTIQVKDEQGNLAKTLKWVKK